MTLLAILRRELRRVADPAKAPAMQAYMKSAMPYHGVSTRALRDVCRQVFILSQITFKADTDLELLYASIEPSPMPASSRRCRPVSSSSARRSAGRCASTRGRIPARWSATCGPTAPS